MQGKLHELEQAIACFAPAEIESTGWLIYWKAMSRLGVAPTESITSFHRAFSLFQAAGDRSGLYLAWVGVVQATLLDGRAVDQLEAWLDVLEELRAKQEEFPSPAIEAQVAAAMLHALDATLRRTVATPSHNPPDLGLRIHVLGTFQVIVSGRPLRATGRSAEFLRAIVALGLVGEVTTERLTHALWPDTEGDKQRRVFDTNLHRLRKWLGDDDTISLEAGRVSLHARCWVDVAELMRVLNAVRSGHDAPRLKNGQTAEQDNRKWLASSTICSTSTGAGSSRVIPTGGSSLHAKVCIAAFYRALPIWRNDVSARGSGVMPSSFTSAPSGSMTPASHSIAEPCAATKKWATEAS
jgi:hypothetical protein